MCISTTADTVFISIKYPDDVGINHKKAALTAAQYNYIIALFYSVATLYSKEAFWSELKGNCSLLES